jgi:hypothetical protein
MNYQTVDDQWVELTDGPFRGLVYQYGRVNLLEEDDVLRIKFEYFMQDGHTDPNTQEFRNYIGDILVELIDTGTMTNSIVFTGGTHG